MIYMWQPKGYEVQGKEHHVCHLLQALYGLKQSRREWYLHFCKAMLKLGLTCCQTEHAMFYHYTDEDILVVTVDVDNLTMTGNSWHVMAKFKWELSGQFKIKDLGDLKWLLGIEVERDHHSHSITF